LTPLELRGKLNEVYVLDMRPEFMFEQGHIKGSRNIPYHLLSKRFQEIPRDNKIVVVDYLGRPSYIPQGWFLKYKGYKDVMMLKGGFAAWEKEGLPLEK